MYSSAMASTSCMRMTLVRLLKVFQLCMGIFGEVALQFIVDVRERVLIMLSEDGERRLDQFVTGKGSECGGVAEHYSRPSVFT